MTYITFSNEVKSSYLVMNIPESLRFHYSSPLDLAVFVYEKRQRKTREKSNSL